MQCNNPLAHQYREYYCSSTSTVVLPHSNRLPYKLCHLAMFILKEDATSLSLGGSDIGWQLEHTGSPASGHAACYMQRRREDTGEISYERAKSDKAAWGRRWTQQRRKALAAVDRRRAQLEWSGETTTHAFFCNLLSLIT